MQQTDTDYVLQRRGEIAERVREVRARRKWTQSQVAEILGCSTRKVNRIEEGKADLSMIEVEMLAKAFDVPLTYFFKRSGDIDAD